MRLEQMLKLGQRGNWKDLWKARKIEELLGDRVPQAISIVHNCVYKMKPKKHVWSKSTWKRCMFENVDQPPLLDY